MAIDAYARVLAKKAAGMTAPIIQDAVNQAAADGKITTGATAAQVMQIEQNAEDINLISQRIENLGDGDVLTDAIKSALLTVLSVVAYTVENGQDYIDILADALNATVTTSVSGNTLTISGFTATGVIQSGSVLTVV